MYKNEELEQENKPVLRFMFWLKTVKPEHQELIEIIQQMKKVRAFAPSLRLGLKIVWALRGGDTSILLKHFPFIVDVIAEQEFLPELEAEKKALRKEWDRLDLYLAGQRNNNSSQGSSLRPVSLVDDTNWLDEEEDIELVVTKDEGAAQNVAQNFLSSLGMFDN